MTQNAFFNMDFSRVNKTHLLMAGVALFAVAMILYSSSAHAGVGGAAFDEIWMTLKDWTQGTLGRIIAGAMILVGIVGGIARQSLMAFAIGIGGGVGLYNTPMVVEEIMSATVTHVPTWLPAAMQLSNGLGM